MPFGPDAMRIGIERKAPRSPSERPSISRRLLIIILPAPPSPATYVASPSNYSAGRPNLPPRRPGLRSRRYLLTA